MPTLLPSLQFSFLYHLDFVRLKPIFPLQQKNLDPHRHRRHRHHRGRGLYEKNRCLPIDPLRLQTSSSEELLMRKRVQEEYWL